MSWFGHQYFLVLSYKSGLITLSNMTNKENSMIYATLDLETDIIFLEDVDDAVEM